MTAEISMAAMPRFVKESPRRRAREAAMSISIIIPALVTDGDRPVRNI